MAANFIKIPKWLPILQKFQNGCQFYKNYKNGFDFINLLVFFPFNYKKFVGKAVRGPKKAKIHILRQQTGEKIQ